MIWEVRAESRSMHWQLFSFASHEFYENEFVVLFTKLRNSVVENARFAFQFTGRSLSFTIHQATFQVPSQFKTIGDRAMDILSSSGHPGSNWQCLPPGKR
jgi:hypothetical protein